MTTISAEKLKEKLAVAGEAFDRTVSHALGRIYWEGLKHCDAEAVEAAIDRAIRELKFFPRLAELLEFIEGSPKARAEIKWAGVLELVQKHGDMCAKKTAVDGAVAFAVERLGGVATLDRAGHEISFLGPRFKALWEYAAARGMDRHAAEIYGSKKRKNSWECEKNSDGTNKIEFLPHKEILAPETIAAPQHAPALESEGQKLIGRQIDGRLASLAKTKAM